MTKVIAVALLSEGGRNYSIGEVVEVSEQRAKVLVRCKLARPHEASDVKDIAGDTGSSTIVPEWKKKVSPEDYLAKWPEGPAAGIAKAIIAASRTPAAQVA